MGKQFYDEPGSTSGPASKFGGKVVRAEDLRCGDFFRPRYWNEKAWIDTFEDEGSWGASMIMRWLSFDDSRQMNGKAVIVRRPSDVGEHSFFKVGQVNTNFHTYDTCTEAAMPYFELVNTADLSAAERVIGLGEVHDELVRRGSPTATPTPAGGR